MIPLSSVSETSSTLPGTWSRSILTTSVARPGQRVLVLDLRLRALHLAEHVLDQRAPVDLADLVRRRRAAVAQHRHAVAQLEDLVEPVRDEDDAAALRDEVARRPEDALDLRLAQGRGRLVEDQQARVADEQPGDLDELPLADRERLDRRPELARGGGRAGRGRRARAPRGGACGRAAARRARRGRCCPRRSARERGSAPGSRARSRAPARPAGSGARAPAPSKRITPSSGRTRPTSAFTSVLLPAPLCPQIACTSPARTSSDSPCTARTGPYDFERSTTSSSTGRQVVRRGTGSGRQRRRIPFSAHRRLGARAA